MELIIISSIFVISVTGYAIYLLFRIVEVETMVQDLFRYSTNLEVKNMLLREDLARLTSDTAPVRGELHDEEV